MDSPFNRQFSLYESAGGRPFDSTTSLNNLASQSTSRLGSPSVASKSLRLDSTLGRNSPKPGLGQNIPWNTANQQPQQQSQSQQQQQQQPAQPQQAQQTQQYGQQQTDAIDGTADPAPADRFSAFNGFANPLGYSNVMGNPSYAGGSTAANTFMGFPSYGGGYGGQLGPYSNQYGSVPYGQQQQQYAGAGAQSQYGGGIYGSQYPYGQSQYGSGGSSFFATTSQAEIDNSAGEYSIGTAKRGTGDIGSTTASRVGSQVASPTISSEEMVLAPANILWHYVDLQGQVQGPFSGVQMNEWLAYMMETTLLRRVNDACFVSFSSLKQAAESDEPFIVLLTSAGWTAVMLKAAQLTNQPQQTAESQSQSQSQQSQQPQQPQQQPQQQQPAASVSAISSLVDQSSVDPAPETDWEPAPARRESSLAPGDNVASAFSSLNISESPKSAAVAPAAPAAPAATVSDEPIEAPKQETAATSVATTPVISKHSIPAAFPPASRDSSATASDAENAAATAAAATVRAEPAPAPAVDPWKKPAKPAAQVSIAELKQQEMQKQKKTKSESVTPRKQSQPSRWLPIEQLQQQQQQQQQQQPSPTSVPATLTGGSAGSSAGSATSGISSPTPGASAPAAWAKKTVHPVRSLAEIQKEQALKTRKANTLAAQTGAAVPATAKTTLGGTKPAVGVSSTVSSKSKPSSIDAATATAAATTTTTTPRAAAGTATPSKSRGPRVVPQTTTTNPATQSITASASKARPTDELIHWARVSFKDLMKGIDPMELLDVFLSLPANGSAKEFIAESIYSYSKSLDGRRFASDFLSRKKTAELSMGPDETWHDVLSRFNFNPNVEQDPSFKVVTKRRTQKIARPGDSMHI